METHADALKEMHEHLKEIFDSSEQGMYLYLDDENKMCNEKFSSMLNYSSSNEWSSIKESFPTAFVAEKSQSVLINAYQDAVKNGVGSSVNIEWKKKSGDFLETVVIIVPISYNGHRMALHFINLA